ncbi:hypothetical protein C8R47DRAFT_1169318, partial [Mycena vitilis]
MGTESFTSKRSKRSADFTPRYSSSSSSSRPSTPSQQSSYTTSSYRANSRSESVIPSPGVVSNMLAALAPAHQQQPPRRLRPDDRAPRSRTPSSSRAIPDPTAWGEPTTPHYVKASPKWNASFADGHAIPPSPRGRFNPTRDTRPPAASSPAPRSKSVLSYADYEARLSHVGYYEDRLPPPVQPPTPMNPRSLSRSRSRQEFHQPKPPLPSLRVQPSTPVRSGFDHASPRSKSPASTRSSSRSPISPNSEGASRHRKNKSWWSGASRSPSPGVEVVVLKEVFREEEKTSSSTRSPSPAPSSNLHLRPEEEEDGYTGTYRKQMGWSGEWTGARGMEDVVRSLRDLRV